ncbi:MAG TPA: alternative ribosome rescue aminoacyl-tRNA hydrolase ArfB [Gemmatimonadales bacterium]|nr:alternative ribosome rescue aminoacyl-tRNA hydrolase ArfB [Gemmatimonadales bacterium]
MTQPQNLEINERVSIPLSELSFRASRSGGPGGQHVNTSSTRIELWWDLAASPSLDDASRARATSRLATRLVDEGRLLRLVSSGSRSQAQNRAEVIERFRSVLAAALREVKPRKRTRPTKASKEQRLQGKKRRGETKRQRRPPSHDE